MCLMHLWDTLNMNNFIKQHPKNSRNTSIYWYYSVFVCKRNMETNYVHVIYDWSSIQACKILVLFLFADQLVHCTMFVNPSISLISLPSWTCTLYRFVNPSISLISLPNWTLWPQLVCWSLSVWFFVIINHLVCFLYTHCMLNDFAKNEL